MMVIDLLGQLREAGIQLHLDGEKLKVKAPAGALTDAIKEQLKTHKEAIIAFLQGGTGQPAGGSSFPTLDRSGPLPLSYNQQGLWFFEQLTPGTAAYTMPVAFKIFGPVNLEAIRVAIGAVMARHEVLRTHFVANAEGEARAVIEAKPEIPFRIETAVASAETLEALVHSLVSQQAMSTFDLERGPLFHLQAIQVQTEDRQPLVTLLLGAMHHIISDGWSLNLFVKELFIAYLKEAAQLPIPLPALPVQYVDFAGWQQQYLASDQFVRKLDWWQQHLAGIPGHLALPTDFPRPPVQGNKGGKYFFTLSSETAQKFTQFCRSQDLTLFMGLMAAWKFVMYRYSGQSDFCLGIPMAGRNHKELEELIGLFIDPLIVRSPLDVNKSLLENLAAVKQEILQAFDHQEVPLARIVDKLQIARNPAYPPVAQVGFQLQDFSGVVSGDALEKALYGKMEELGQLRVERITIEETASKFDMIVSLTRNDESLSGYIEYNADIFVEGTIARMMRHFEQVMDVIPESAEILLRNLSLVSDSELRASLNAPQAEEIRPITDTQMLLYMDSVIHPDTIQNSVGTLIDIPFALDEVIAEKALAHIVANYSTLRTRFASCELAWADNVYQIVDAKRPTPFSVEAADGRNLEQIRERGQKWIYCAYDIHSTELFAFRLFQVSETHCILGLKFHHIISDGSSVVYITDQFTEAYDAIAAGNPPPSWPDAFGSYVAYRRANVDLPETLQFWKSRLRDCSPLSFSPIPGAPRSADFEVPELIIPGDHRQQIERFCKENATYPLDYFRVIMAALVRHYCRPDSSFTFNEIQGARRYPRDTTFGVFYQVVPYLVDLDWLANDTELATAYKALSSWRKECRDYRNFSALAQLQVTEASPVRFQFNYFNFIAKHTCQGQPLTTDLLSPRVENTAQFILKELTEQWLLQLWVDRTALDDHRFLERAVWLSQQIVDGKAKTIGEFDYVLPDERSEIAKLNNVHATLSSHASIVTWFEQSAAQHADHTAVIHGSTALTYAELNAKANQLAHALVAKGLGKGSRVAILLSRRVEVLVAVLATLKSGAAYVPVEASYPCERIQYIVKDSGASIVITEACQRSKLGDDEIAIFDVDADLETLVADSNQNLAVHPAAGDEIYVIYTSGSTGQPKGASVQHRGEVNLQRWYLDALKLDAQDRTLIISAFGFDLTQKNLFALLLVGGTIVLPEMDEYDDALIRNALHTHQITLINCAPSAFYPLVSEPQFYAGASHLRWVVLGGEPIRLPLLYPWLSHASSRAQLVNSYGPTECTDVVAYHILETLDSDTALIPIGLPVPNCELHILDDNLANVAPGLIGELCVSGICVGNGYVGRPDLTEAAFIDHPNALGKVYRTGDLCRQLPSGEIEYIGRKDFQVKVRGLRIELGEIEKALSETAETLHSQVSDSLVIVRDEKLIAYIVAPETLDTASLRNGLRARLPEYMVPNAIICLPKWPLTPNGKVDRKALPAPDQASSATVYVAPRNEIEQRIAQIWQDILKIDRVGVEDNFFELGGHSLLATQIVSRTRSAFNIQLALRDLMGDPTVAELARHVARAQGGSGEPDLVVINRNQRLPLSFAQQRLWLLDQIEPGSTAYNVPAAIRIYGSLDVRALEQALSSIFNRHEGLRAIFLEDEQGPYQQIMPEQFWPLSRTDLSRETQPETELLRRAAIELMTPFELDQGPLFRAHLFDLGTQTQGQHSEPEVVFSLVIHHIVTDGWSMGILIRELAQAYFQYSTHGRIQWLPEPFQYLDFAHWQRTRLGAERISTMLGYWKATLDQVPVLNLPTDKPRPPVQTFNGASTRFNIPKQTRSALTQLAQSENASLFMALLAAFAATLQRYSGQDDFAIGTPVAGRDQTELESIVGFFVNTLAIRMNPQSTRSFRNLLQETRQRALDGFSQQEIPFEQLVEVLSPARDMSRSPLFQVMMVYQNLPIDQNGIAASTDVGNIRIEPFNPGIDTAKFDITLTLWDENEGLGGAVQYNTDLFHADTIERLCGHFAALTERLAHSPDVALHSHEYLNEAEREQQLIEWNLTQTEYDANVSVQQWIDQTAERTPDAIAIRCGDQQLSYRELQTRANQTAHYLIAHGVKPDDRVAIVLDRNLHLMTAILGVIKAGAAYVPLDASYPEERIRYILDNADIQVGITRSHLTDNLPAQKQWIRWDEEYPQIQQQPEAAPAIPHHIDRLLYVIFTSGSTGQPKGTAAYQRSEINLQHWYTGQFGMNPQDNLLLLSATGFDLTQKNLFGALIAGATLVIPAFQEYDAHAIGQLIEREAITWINCAPSAFYPLQDEPWQWNALSKLRRLFLGGEPINLPRLATWLRQSRCQLVNSYGPTECTDIATYYVIDADRDLQASALPIGRPNDNVRLYVLGEQQELLPIGAIGELCIGGDGVGPGYLNQAELTRAVFINNPHKTGETIYRTGDRVRYRPDGVIEYYGRRDHQIKLRGYRIEVGEIQSVLNQTEGIKDSLVDVLIDDNKVQRLIGWIETADTSDSHRQALQKRCRDFLPSYMVPEQLLLLEEFPLTPNGKVDRKALPKPQTEGQADYVAPRNALEAALAGIWSEVLRLDEISIHANFFELGGHSLLATQVVARIRKKLGFQLAIRDLMMQPTIAELAQKIALSQRIEGEPELLPIDRSQRLPLSFAQQRLWLLDQIEQGSSAYNLPSAIRIRGELDTAALERALSVVFNRHEGLRAVFLEDEQGSYQSLLPEQDWPLTITDLRAEKLPETELMRLAAIELMTSFELDRGPLFRARLFRVAENEAVFTLIIHHIVTDGWSMGILIRDLATAYVQIHALGECRLPSQRLQYLDFTLWQRACVDDARLSQMHDYWKKQLQGVPALNLPTDKTRPPLQTYNSGTVRFTISALSRSRLTRFAQSENASLFMALIAGFAVLLKRYSGQSDFAIGTPVAGRERAELENIVGFFVNTLAVRVQPENSLDFRGLLRQVQKTVLDGFSNQEMPFEEIVDAVATVRDLSRSPLFQVMLAYQNLPPMEFGLGDTGATGNGTTGNIEISRFDAGVEAVKYDLYLTLWEESEGLGASFQYNTDLFLPETAEAMVAHFCHLLDSSVEDPACSLDRIDIMPPRIAQQILLGWNQTASQYERDIPVTRAIEQQTAENPARIALIFGEDRYTYAEINARANQLSHYLVESGLQSGDFVGVLCDRSLDMVLALIAVLKAGAAYVPIDPDYPLDRIQYVVNSAKPRFVLSQQAVAERIPLEATRYVLLDTLREAVQSQPETNLSVELDPRAPGYVIYTSGSTGNPKGVVIGKDAFVNFIHGMNESIGMCADDRSIAITSLSFDISGLEMFMPLVNGACIVLASAEQGRDAEALVALLEKEHVTFMQATPATWHMLVQEHWQPPAGFKVLCGGEPMPVALANRLVDLGVALYNVYGPTETTVWSTVYHLNHHVTKNVSVGRPIANTSIYVLDEHHQPVPVGVPGELFIGGHGVAAGYLHRPDLTEERFIANPFNDGLSDRIYQTGDLVRYLPDGNLECLGRLDHQIKIRGFRIELGEIEAVLNKKPEVREGIVHYHDDAAGVKYLVGYVVANEGAHQEGGVTPADLRAHLSQTLPDYMVPTVWVFLNEMPLTPNGKVDRKALPKPDEDNQEQREYAAPETSLQKALAELWAEILHVERVGLHDNFFELGGQSLLATKLVSQIRRKLKTPLAIRDLMVHATIAELAQVMEQNQGQAGKPAIKPRTQFGTAALSYGQQRLWFFEQMNPGTAANNMPAALKIRGKLRVDVLEKALQELIRRHETLRTHFTTDADGEARQIIEASVDWSIGHHDLSALSDAEFDQQLSQRTVRNLLTPIDLGDSSLLRVNLITRSEGEEYYLLFCMHHIISDAASIMIFIQELVVLYTVFSLNKVSPLPELRIQYADYAEWQRTWLSRDRMESQLTYWREKLDGAPVLLELPFDKPRPAQQSTEGASLSFRFDEGFTQRMRAFCVAQQLTPFMFTLAAWKLLLSKYSGKTDIVIGVPSLGRDMPEVERIIGFFIHSFALRTRFDDNPTVAEALQRVRTTVLEAFSNGDVPIDMLVEELGIRRNPSYSPLVQVAFQLMEQGSLAQDTLSQTITRGTTVGDISVEPLGSVSGTAKFDITLNLNLAGDQLAGSFEYGTALFDVTTIQRLANQFCTLCESLLDDVETSLHAITLEQGAAQIRALELDPEEIEQVLPLSAMQYDMFMDSQINPGSLQSSHGWHISIHKPLDVALWQRCVQMLCNQQPMLRVRFVAGLEPWHEMGYLAVRRTHTVPFTVIDLSKEPFVDEVAREARVDAIIHKQIYQPYDLQQDELIRYGVVKCSETHYVVFTAVHHAVLDGAALNSLWEQITALYVEQSKSPQTEAWPSIQPLAANFDEFVAYDRRVMDTAPVLAFWRERFANVEPLDFTVPMPVPAQSRFTTRERWLDEMHQKRLRQFCRKQGITPALYLKSLYALMIQAYCRPDADFVIQETMGGRIKGHTHSLGCYIQEVPFILNQTALTPVQTVGGLFEYARDFQKATRDQRLISIGQQLALVPRGRVGFMFNYYQFLAHTEFLGETFNPEGTPSDPANNVQFVVTEVGGKLKFNLFYHGHLFADFGLLERIESLSQQILDAAAQQQDLTLQQLRWVNDPVEQNRLLRDWNDTETPFDLSLCVHQHFEQQVEQHPDCIAVADDLVSYSYAELNRRANQLAHYLREQGVQRNHLVGLCAERSADFLMAILAIMKSGAAYVPMDARYPQDRIDYMIQNSDVDVLITQQTLLDKVGREGKAQRLCLDRDWPHIANQPDHNPNVPSTPRDRAYMLYTSGSTGLPKGAIIRHDGAMNHIEAERKDLHFNGAFNFLQSAPASSDISVWQFVGAVTCGGKTVILDDITNAPKLFRLVNEQKINLVELVPVALQLLMEHVRSLPESERAMPCLKWMMATGESVPVDLVNDWLQLYPNIPVVNAYGPTEAADDVIQATIRAPLPAHYTSVPIGKPLANLGVFILDAQSRLVPPGIAGEICIGGIGVGEGYWRNEEKTAAAFVPNPFNVGGDTLYRTGDLGRWLADGTVECLGRIDHQVKVRGFRIELGEIEAVLSAQEGVREAAVIVRHDLPGGATLVGYATADDGVKLSVTSLRAGLRERLPEHMVPTSLNLLERMPLTPAGKIDRKGLPRPESIQLGETEYVAPRTELEAQLASLWAAFLPVEQVGLQDDFFELGGHSLIAVRLVARINKELGTQLQVAALLSAQNIEKLARLIEEQADEEQGTSLLIPLATTADDKPALFFIHPVGGDVLLYRDLAKALAPHYRCYGLRAHGLEGQTPAATLDEMLESYRAEIQRIQPSGPYQLAGQSLGGLFALALAHRLEQVGETVHRVIMLDSFSPAHLRATYKNDAEILGAALGQPLQTEQGDNVDTWLRQVYRLAVAAGVITADVPESQFRALYQVAVNNHRLASALELAEIETQAHVQHFTAMDNPLPVKSGESWQDTEHNMVFYQVVGGHESMMQGVNAATLGHEIAKIW
ncbi:Non-ribosomal peptide synthetase modules and related proteins [gamma proteobacterium HdN1]|nr:Non-ribosomal peptide synthetase modules and related proteins [gamma proteobacterium HdN1]